MKYKIIIFLIAAALTFSMSFNSLIAYGEDTSIFQNNETTADEIASGDVTKDGILDVRDGTAILTFYAKTSAGENVSFEDLLK